MEREKTTHRDIDLSDLIKAICARPMMYVGERSFNKVAIFINGFSYASSANTEELAAFTSWIGIKLKLPKNWLWFAILKKRYSNDEDIFQELPQLFEEFRDNRKNKSD